MKFRPFWVGSVSLISALFSSLVPSTSGKMHPKAEFSFNYCCRDFSLLQVFFAPTLCLGNFVKYSFGHGMERNQALKSSGIEHNPASFLDHILAVSCRQGGQPSINMGWSCWRQMPKVQSFLGQCHNKN
jgi:hypothetical protein